MWWTTSYWWEFSALLRCIAISSDKLHIRSSLFRVIYVWCTYCVLTRQSWINGMVVYWLGACYLHFLPEYVCYLQWFVLGEVLMGYFYQNTETSTVPTSTWNLSCNAAMMGIVPPLINASTCCGAKITYLAFPSSFIIISTETHFKATATTGSAHMLTILQVGIWVPVSRQTGCTRRVFPLGPFKCYVTLFFWKLDPHPPPRNANNIEHDTFVTLFPRESDTLPPPSALRNTWMAPL